MGDVETGGTEGDRNEGDVQENIESFVEDQAEIDRINEAVAKADDFWKRLYEEDEFVKERMKEVFGLSSEGEDVEQEVRNDEDMFEQFDDIDRMFVDLTSTEASESVSTPVSTPPIGSSSQPYSFESFKSFDELRRTPEIASQVLDKCTFKRIVREAFNSEKVLPDNFPTEWSEEQLRFINRGYFFTDKEKLAELKVTPKEAAFKVRYLEERAYPIFCGLDKVTIMKKAEELSMYPFKLFHQVEEYKELLKSAKNMKSSLLQEHRMYRIKSLIEVKMINKVSISVPTFIVLRENNKRYRFSEAQFQLMPVDDIIFLYTHFLNALNRCHEDLIGFEAVKRFISSCVKVASFEDFQIGFEMSKDKINVPYPDQTLYSEDIEKLSIGHVIKEPTPGVVFVNSLKKKIFIRFSELAAYSDGTLEYCKNVLSWLKDDEGDKKKKRLLKKAVTKIEKRLKIREDIRKLRNAKNIKQSENIVRRRGGCWIRYAPSHVLGAHNVPPPNFEENMNIPDDRPPGDNWFWHPNKVVHRRLN